MIRRQAIVGLAALSMVSCNAASAPEIPGLDPNDEVELVEVDPAPSDDLYVWTHAVQVGDLPVMNVGHPTAQFLEDAARVEEDSEDYVCIGDASESVGCSVEDPEAPSISGMTFGGPDVMAWSWVFLPVDAVAVSFIDQEDRTTWQRPFDRIVIFPDPVEGGSDDVVCACQLDAMSEDGELIISVDVDSVSYIDD